MKMAASRRKQDDKNLEILRELISQNGNKHCFDCNQRGPTYVNTTIGSFVCSKCSGMLRGLTPPHRVKSISMATFTPEEIEFIKVKGNDFCRRVWLGLFEGESVNYSDEQSVRDFMSEKYEKKLYHLDSSSKSAVVLNGNCIQNSKSKQKLGSAAVATPLVAISSRADTTGSNNNVITTAKVMPTLPIVQESHKIARPVNNLSYQSSGNASSQPSVQIPPPIPDFPVDFSTANIYNSAHYNNTLNNNNLGSPSSFTTTPAFDAFNCYNAQNDRYAALADLDLVFRQQNMKNTDESTTISSKNPFQSSSADVFVNRNPFANGVWNTATAPITVNPFTTSNQTIVNSNNPFL
ncbi:unnamed protein product [Leptidea sinapis]|uniref:Arf-GAP domain-containing protein n=1 Tax=Leptidea sinapis TaxID=189913 RepID=A0A5E4QV20_9NEOP|nr:unnamed protein product [Leptidea sinapis]